MRNYSIGSTSARVKLAEIGRPSTSFCNYPSPQHSFEYSHVAIERQDTSTKSVTEVPEAQPTRSKVSLFEKEPVTKGATKAPLISISAIVGDLPSDSSFIEPEETANDEGIVEVTEEEEKEEPEAEKSDTVIPTEESAAISSQAEMETKESSVEDAQVVPVWEPDTQQGDQMAPTSETTPQQKRDNNVNEVCPWEDE